MRRPSWIAAAIAALLLSLGGARAAPSVPAPRDPRAPADVGRDLAVGISALVTALAAFLGINAWRRRLLGATAYKIAFKTLEALFALRESIEEARVRAPIPLGRLRDLVDADLDGEAEVRLAEGTYRERLFKVNAAREDLLEAQKEALALWGDEAKDALTPIHDVVQDLAATSERYFVEEIDRVRRAAKGGAVEPDAEAIAMKRILYSIPDARGKDPFGERIARAVATAEEFYRGRLR